MSISSKTSVAPRYLVCRPAGGLNDCLVQIERCREYAQNYNRILTIDFSLSGVSEPFLNIFETNEDIGVSIVKWTPELCALLDSMDTVVPNEVAHRVASYKHQFRRLAPEHRNPMFDTFGKAIVEYDSGVPVTFDFDSDYSESVLVHAQFGGGHASLRLLEKLSFTAETANEIIVRILDLGDDYDAVHIRHSDYRTNYRRMLLVTMLALFGRRVLVCSDSKTAKNQARLFYFLSSEVLSISDIPETHRAPLHTASEFAGRDNDINMLCDLMALAGSKRLFFGSSKRGVVSGFSMLAEGLRSQPHIVRNLFKNADEKYFVELFGNDTFSNDSEHFGDSIGERLRSFGVDLYRQSYPDVWKQTRDVREFSQMWFSEDK